MNLKQLREIIRAFEQSSLTALDVREGEERVRLERQPARPPPRPDRARGRLRAGPGAAGRGGRRPRLQPHRGGPLARGGHLLRAPEPGGKPFVQVGDRVRKGDVLCLIEVMKQVTEVTAPQDGQVADICSANGSLVEYDQTLIKLC